MSRIVTGLVAATLFVSCALTTPTLAAGPKSVAVKGTATVLKPVTVTVTSNISSGYVKTQGNNPSGTVTMPATYPLFASPVPTYTNFASAKNGSSSDLGKAAQIDLTGTPLESFTVVLSGWAYVSGDTPISMTAPTYYSPSGTPTTAAKGTFNAQGKATVYIGATFTIPRDNNGTTVIMRPQFAVNYN